MGKEASEDKDVSTPFKETTPQPGKDDKQTTIPGIGDHIPAGKTVNFTVAGDRETMGRVTHWKRSRPNIARAAWPGLTVRPLNQKKGAPLRKGAPFLWSNGKPDCGIYVVNF